MTSVLTRREDVRDVPEERSYEDTMRRWPSESQGETQEKPSCQYFVLEILVSREFLVYHLFMKE
jgi:hypothetical protein